MPALQTFSAVDVVHAPGAIRIQEFFGNVASADPRLSACLVTVETASEEAWQTPRFDEYVLVIEGAVELHLSGEGKEEVKTVKAGSGAFLPRGLRVKWVWPGPCKYVPICLPAFTPDNCAREEVSADAAGRVAKTDEAMGKLRGLHADTAQEMARRMHPFLYHATEKKLWERVQAEGGTYFPPTFAQDGNYTHATANAGKLIPVLNHFYRKSSDDWVCLKMTLASLEACGIETFFEAPSPVGDTPAFEDKEGLADADGKATGKVELFPHIQGGIPAGAVLEVTPIRRGADGEFLAVEGNLV